MADPRFFKRTGSHTLDALAELTGARLRGAQLTGAIYDQRTVFPRGFKPEDAGMVMSLRKSSSTDKPRPE